MAGVVLEWSVPPLSDSLPILAVVVRLKMLYSLPSDSRDWP